MNPSRDVKARDTDENKENHHIDLSQYQNNTISSTTVHVSTIRETKSKPSFKFVEFPRIVESTITEY